jgi:predicted GNAT family acetyltransferase
VAEVVDNPDEDRFELVVDGLRAELLYRVEDGHLILIHTEVPDALGGRGLGGQLVRAALARAERDGLTVVPWCPFARRWLKDHPDEAGAVAIDWAMTPG